MRADDEKVRQIARKIAVRDKELLARLKKAEDAEKGGRAMRYFTSDTHFGHANIIKFCERPFKDFAHMDEALIANWNETVTPDDHIYHLGDLAMGSFERWDGILSRLNGHKHLVIGNHDRIFAKESPNRRAKFQPVYEGWFETITESAIIGINGETVNMSHFPYNGDSHDGDRYDDMRLHDNGNVLLHGHTHAATKTTRSNIDTLQIHVGVDAWGYKPVSENQIVAIMDREK